MWVGGWAGAVPILRATVNFGENAYMFVTLTFRPKIKLIWFDHVSVRAFLPSIYQGTIIAATTLRRPHA